ncbi:MAG: hypothetical protein DWQ40_07675 [Actinobacteria bacterium]|nr:MAG: hypothetical protein DWQ40_07675 [Actinomycetota bacterium]REK39728.1 MAG: hypothetical protein DWQ20_02860 [Actinomycetota bacterium]
MNSLVRIVAGILVIALAAPAVAEVTDEQVRHARDEMNALVAESADLGAQVEEAWARQFALEHEIAQLQESIEFARAQLTELKAKLEEVAVEMYMGSSSATQLMVLISGTDEDFKAASEYLKEVNGVETGVLNELRNFRAELDRQTQRLAEASEEQAANAAQLEELAGQLYADLAEAQAVYDQLVTQQAIEEEQRRLEEERRRQEEAAAAAAAATSTTTTAVTTTAPTSDSSTTTAPPTTSPPPPPPSGDGACPVAGAVYFSDTWGDPRSGGRSHQGVDMMAAAGTPIAAIYSGTVYLSTNTLGGKTIWLTSNAGDKYYYAHLDSYVDVSSGQSVTEGQIIGTVGSTGNASALFPHLHFEFHPGGGSAVNPYPLVKSICG